jgi:signal transduction histidine kinase
VDLSAATVAGHPPDDGLAHPDPAGLHGVEVEPDTVSIFVRDRGVGFDRVAVGSDRRGIADSIESRLRRAGGSATITSSPGNGTEIELTMPRGGHS